MVTVICMLLGFWVVGVVDTDVTKYVPVAGTKVQRRRTSISAELAEGAQKNIESQA